ncbi:hypothetical protein RR46_12465 [Papilio xuthus]|uniref:Uncharacterized protein n=1 Tax=Papilio xuthus TaxID=66420 RepID=A0A194PZ52_PAPXU|nr:hypothetical protein RR46_12465 [Papilio xuthus]
MFSDILEALNLVRVAAQNTILGVVGYRAMREEGTAQRTDDLGPPRYIKRVIQALILCRHGVLNFAALARPASHYCAVSDACCVSQRLLCKTVISFTLKKLAHISLPTAEGKGPLSMRSEHKAITLVLLLYRI